jgi:hypothetical protein
MSGLQDESRIETAGELIADWERVLLGEATFGKTLPERRLFQYEGREKGARHPCLHCVRAGAELRGIKPDFRIRNYRDTARNP